AVGPAATLARGYAVVQRVAGPERHVVRSIDDAPAGSQLRIRVGDGAISAAGLGTTPLGEGSSPARRAAHPHPHDPERT
ncbi:hypothetical protein, partial [Saezia sanguinis]